MEIILHGLQYKKCLVQLVDVIKEGGTFEEALYNLIVKPDF